MEKYLLKQDEVVLYKGNTAFQDTFKPKRVKNYNTELCLTNLNVILTTGTKKFLSKEEIDVEVYGIDTIKMYNDTPQVIKKNDIVEIYFLNQQKCLQFPNKKEGKEFVEQVIKLVSGKSKFVREVLKVKKAIENTAKAIDIDVGKIAKGATQVGLKTAVGMAKTSKSGKVTQWVGNIAKHLLPSDSTKNEVKLLSNNEQVEQLTQLKKLLDDGAITQQEYDTMKKQILEL